MNTTNCVSRNISKTFGLNGLQTVFYLLTQTGAVINTTGRPMMIRNEVGADVFDLAIGLGYEPPVELKFWPVTYRMCLQIPQLYNRMAKFVSRARAIEFIKASVTVSVQIETDQRLKLSHTSAASVVPSHRIKNWSRINHRDRMIRDQAFAHFRRKGVLNPTPQEVHMLVIQFT